MIVPLSSTAEILLEQIMGTLFLFNPEVDEPDLQQALSAILTQYDIKPALVPNGHPDLAAKIKLFLAGKRLEGLATSTLENYALELRIFSEHVHKAANEITTADIRTFLGECTHLKTSSLSRRLSVLKSMFGWLANEGVITKDPTKQIKPPKKEQRTPKVTFWRQEKRASAYIPAYLCNFDAKQWCRPSSCARPTRPRRPCHDTNLRSND